MSLSAIDQNNLAFSALFTTAKGAKQLPALSEDGHAIIWQPKDFVEVPFEPSAFNDPDANRVTICVSPSKSMCENITILDEWCIDNLTKDTTGLLGIQLSPTQVRERYVSCLKTSEDKGYATLRMKMNRSGKYALQCYNSDKERCVHPDTWKGVKIQPRIAFKGLWIMGKDFGAMMECTHAMVEEGGDTGECPF